MAELSAEDIAQRAFGLELLDDRSLREVRSEIASGHLDGAEFQQLLLRRDLLTPYQMKLLLRGDRTGFFYGKYKVLYQVGSGSFARVYRAIHRDTQETGAVKVLRKRFSEDLKKRERFRREAELGITLRHPNIVGIHEVGAERSGPYIVMEFVEGQSLREFIKNRRKVEIPDAIRLMADIMRGLDYAARRGISHRDMKASNVLVSSAGQAKLVDFGLAGVDPDADEEGLSEMANPRTLDYLALDRASGVSNSDTSGDIYFAGCILYQMLSGQPALFETRDRVLRANKSRIMEITPLKKLCPDLPPPIMSAVDRGMELNPKHRYQTPGEMLTDLTALQRRLQTVDPNDPSGLANFNLSSKQRTLLLVESNPKLQDALRDQLKRSGFRVLVTGDPHRPLEWFAGGKSAADCVLYSTGQLGEQALKAFNEFGTHNDTAKVPALLLLGSKHADWTAQAKTSPHRATLLSPLKVPELLELLNKVIAAGVVAPA